MPTRLIALLLTAALTLVGCDPQGSSPVPQPVPGFVRTSTHDLQQEELLVVGLPGAVAGEGRVHIEDRKGGARVVVNSITAGTFSAVIAARSDEDLSLRFENEDGLSDPLRLREADPLGPHPQLAPSNTYSDVVSPTDAGGLVVVSNDGGAANPPLIAATPEVDVIVTNGNTSDVVTDVTDAAGLFTVQLPGSTGDLIHILLVSPEETGLTSDFLSYKVP